MDPGAFAGILAIFMVFLCILVPIVGVTARIALKPIMESWAKYRELRGADETVNLLGQRMALMEEQLHGIQRVLGHIQEEMDFRRQLETGGSAGALPSAARPQPRSLDADLG